MVETALYHTTANILAPARLPGAAALMAYGTELKSAVHGPLFPVVLLFFSRMGGTTYFDHGWRRADRHVVVLGVLRRPAHRRARGGYPAVSSPRSTELWLIDGVLFPEGLMAALVVFTILAAYKWNDRPAAARAVSGLGRPHALARGEGVLLMVSWLLPLILRNKTLVRRERLRQFGLYVHRCLLVLAPWTIRNLFAFEVSSALHDSNEVLMYANCKRHVSGQVPRFWVFDCQDRIRARRGRSSWRRSRRRRYWRRSASTNQGPQRTSARGRSRSRRSAVDVFRPGRTEFAPIEGRNGTARKWVCSRTTRRRVRYQRQSAPAQGRVRLLPLTSQFCRSRSPRRGIRHGALPRPGRTVLCLLAAVGVAR